MNKLLKSKILNLQRSVFQALRVAMLKLHYKFGITTVLPPVSCQVEITTVCNYNCVMCNRNFVDKDRKNKMMSAEQFKVVLKNLPKSVRHLFFVGQLGDAFCHPDFYKILDLTTRAGYQISIATNGGRLSRDTIDKLIKFNLWRMHVSLDSTEQKVYSDVRGGNVEKILDNLIYLKAKRPVTQLYLAMVVMKDTIGGIEGFFETARKLMAEQIILQMMIPYSMEIWQQQSLDNYPDMLEKLSSYVEQQTCIGDIKLVRGGGSRNWSFKPENSFCDSAFFLPQIMVNGDIVPCCMVSNADKEFSCGVGVDIKPTGYILGNVLEKPLSEIWNNDKAKSVRRQIIKAWKFYNKNNIKSNHPHGDIDKFVQARRQMALKGAFDYCSVCTLRWQCGG